MLPVISRQASLSVQGNCKTMQDVDHATVLLCHALHSNLSAQGGRQLPAQQSLTLLSCSIDNTCSIDANPFCKQAVSCATVNNEMSLVQTVLRQ